MSLINDINEGLRRPLTSEKSFTNVVANLMTEVVDSIPTDVIKYKAGQNITISDDGTISATDMDTKYTAGKYIGIGDDRVVNSTITAGTNINIDSTGKISATDTKYTAGSNVKISSNNVISATDTTYTAGTGIEISGNTINCTVEAGTDYTLPTASASILGGIKVGANLSIDGNGTLSATDTTYTDATTSKSGLMSASDKTKLDGLNNYSLPTATQQSLGGIKVGTNLSITADGTLSATDTNTTYTAGQNVQISQDNVISATDTKYVAGDGIDITGNLISCTITDTTYSDATTSTSGLMSAADKTKLESLENYTLPTASDSVLGGVKVGSNLSVTADGTLSATDTTYSDATTSTSGLMSAADKTKLDSLENYVLPAEITATTITLTDAEGSVSINAAQLRQLLALLNPEA